MEPDQRNAFVIEKMLNCLGYYSIAQPITIEEALVLNQFNGRCFDVLLAPEYLIKPSAKNFYPLHCFKIKNIFIYGCPTQSSGLSARLNGMLHSSTNLPDFKSLESFMAYVECGTLLPISKQA